MTTAKITIRESDDADLISRLSGWIWWWRVEVATEARSGFGRTRAKAIAKAEAAGRKLAAELTTRPAHHYERWTINLDEADDTKETRP